MANPTKAFGLRAPQAEGHTSFHTQNFKLTSTGIMKPGVTLKINRSSGELEISGANEPIDYVIQSLTDKENKPVPILNDTEEGTVQVMYTKTYDLWEIQADDDGSTDITETEQLQYFDIIVNAEGLALLDSDTANVLQGPLPLEAVGFGNRIPAIEPGRNPIMLVRVVRFTP